MERLALLSKLRSSCADVRGHFDSRSAEWLAGIVPASPTSDPTEKPASEYLYELLCYFALLRALKSAGVQNLRLIRAPGRNGFRFPYAPGEKSNFAYFRFEWDGNTYDLCAGTGVHPPESPEDDPDEHPDISLQRLDGEKDDLYRLTGEVIAIWDAKYHDKHFSKTDENQLLRWCTLFPRTKGSFRNHDGYYGMDDLLDALCPPAFRVSAVITNARKTSYSKASALKYGYSFVFKFDGDGHASQPTPTRDEHYLHSMSTRRHSR